MVGATGTGTPRPAARPTPVPGVALDPNNLALSCCQSDGAKEQCDSLIARFVIINQCCKT